MKIGAFSIRGQSERPRTAKKEQTLTTNDDPRLRGKVAAILSKRELIINLGEEDGVRVGMKFVILNSQGMDIQDPDTGAVLGTVEVPKTVVKVVRVGGAHLAVARTFRKIAATPGLLGAVASMPNFTGTPSRTETLDIESGSSLKAELSEEQSYIKIGDVAVETEGDEYDDL
ncbi:MAG: hypothetical protein KKE65_08540 [Actinobacteria bacterium]|nr:hypothetical protein [Actinomycetota bacterium]MBU2111693.1 hypothetical protein [Actinomycetota bacterium]